MVHSIHFKRLFFSFFAFCGLLLVVYSYFERQHSLDTVQRFQHEYQQTDNFVDTLISAKAEKVALIALSLAQKSLLEEAMSNQDLSSLDFQRLVKEIAKHSTLENVGVQVIDSKGYSLYRTWSDMHGDPIIKKRKDLQALFKSPKVTHSVSVGTFDLTFKTMVPVYKGRQFIGVLEVLAKFNSIAEKLKSKGLDTVILVKEFYKQQLQKPFTEQFLNDNYVANIDAKPDLLEVIQHHQLREKAQSKEYSVLPEIDQFVTYKTIYGIDNKPLATFFLFQSLSPIINSAFKQSAQVYLYLLAIYVFLVLGYFWHNSYRFSKRIKDRLKLQKSKLDFIALNDALTHLPNRTLFLDRLQQALDNAKHSELTVGVLFIDLDRFKEINETFGHRIGDEVLIECSKRLRNAVRVSDTVARQDGRVFSVILDNVADNNEIAGIVQKLLHVITLPFNVEGKSFYLTVSIGISTSSDDGDEAHELMRNAYTAMSQAKLSGPNNYEFYSFEMTQKALRRVHLETMLRTAIKERQFVLHYQPQFDIGSNEIVGFEALVRWISPEEGMISPADFIPLAEETGLIIELGKQVMLDAMLTIADWHNKGLTDKRVAINVSAKQFQDENLLKVIKDSLMAANCRPEWVEIEITESSVMTNQDHTVKVLEALQGMGITISIDDFGTGYSSLAELKRMPIDKLKIDQSFVRNLPESREDTEISRAIIFMSKSLDIDLIAEGIETFEQADFMQKNGCMKAQGYFYSRPVEAAEVEVLLQNTRKNL